MVLFQLAFFLAGLHQDIGVDLVVGAAADGGLLDEQLQAVIAGGAEIDLILPAFANFHGQEGIGKRLPTEGDHIHVALFDILGAISQQGAVFGGDGLQAALALAKDRVVRADHHGILFTFSFSTLAKILVQVGEVGMVLIRLGQADGDGWAAGGLDEELRAALFQAFDQVDRFGQVDHRGIRSGGAKPAREAFPDGDLGADQEVLIRDGFADAFVQIEGELAAVFPRAAVFPLAGVVGAQDLRAQVAVAELHVDAICAHIVGHLGSQDEISHDLFEFILGENIRGETRQRFDREAFGEFRIAQLAGVGQLEDEERLGVHLAHAADKFLQRSLVLRHDEQLVHARAVLIGDGDRFQADQARLHL